RSIHSMSILHLPPHHQCHVSSFLCLFANLVLLSVLMSIHHLPTLVNHLVLRLSAVLHPSTILSIHRLSVLRLSYPSVLHQPVLLSLHLSIFCLPIHHPSICLLLHCPLSLRHSHYLLNRQSLKQKAPALSLLRHMKPLVWNLSQD